MIRAAMKRARVRPARWTFALGLPVASVAMGCFNGLMGNDRVVYESPEGGALSDAVSPANLDASDASLDSPDSPDSAGSPDGTSDGAAFFPLELSNLALWLDPTTLAADAGTEGGAVGTWIDSSKNQIALTQTTPAAMPSLTSHKGRTVVEFGPTDDAGAPDQWLQTQTTDIAALDFSTADVLLEVVIATSPSNVGIGCFFEKTNLYTPPFDGLQLFASYLGGGKPGGGITGSDVLSSSLGNTEDGSFHVVGVQRAGDQLTLRLDGAATETQLIVAEQVVDTDTHPLFIGGRDDGANPFLGYFGDAVLVVGKLAPSDLASLEGYLMTKYGIVSIP